MSIVDLKQNEVEFVNGGGVQGALNYIGIFVGIAAGAAGTIAYTIKNAPAGAKSYIIAGAIGTVAVAICQFTGAYMFSMVGNTIDYVFGWGSYAKKG